MARSQPVHYFDAADPAMVDASTNARETFKYFWRELSWERRRIVPGLDLACVKLAFAESLDANASPTVEHMWINDVDFDGRTVSGTLINSPNWLQSVSKGDHITATLERVGDWMFAISGKVYGGYTVNLIRSRMSPSERKAHDKAWGLDFGDPATVSLVYVASGKQGADGLLARFRHNPGPDRNAEAAALLDHPMSLNVERSVRQQLIENPQMLNDRDERGWTLLHREALAGNRNIVRLLLELGADHTVRTPEGHTALDLARLLDWSATVEILSGHQREPS